MDPIEEATGTRVLSEGEVRLLRYIESFAANVAATLDSLTTNSGAAGVTLDARWFAIAKTDLQIGLMALRRSVAKPNTF